jgi:hypothetical protein
MFVTASEGIQQGAKRRLALTASNMLIAMSCHEAPKYGCFVTSLSCNMLTKALKEAFMS